MRLYGEDSIVNIQCPFKTFQKTFSEALSNKFKKWVPYLKLKDGDIQINEKSQWYAEVQGQLHITGWIEVKDWVFFHLKFIWIFPRKKHCLFGSLDGKWIYSAKSIGGSSFLGEQHEREIGFFFLWGYAQRTFWSS